MPKVKVYYLDPAGNKTAIVEDKVPFSERIILAKKIMALGDAEQVGFITAPKMGGDCRLEMMGGEFCGNATRSYGYLKAQENGAQEINVEISGAKEPVPVVVDPEDHTAFAQMPFPLGKSMIFIKERDYPVIHMEGIDHLIVKNMQPDQEFVKEAVEILVKRGSEACGILFLEKEKEYKMTPAVYVKATDSLVWESSCGSGSVACAWYLQSDPALSKIWKDDWTEYKFIEPGGIIKVTFSKKDDIINRCFMGGPVKLEKTITFIF